MYTETTSPGIRRPALLLSLLTLLGLAALVVFYFTVVNPFILQITDRAGPFYLTFSAADLDGDGDLDLLVHNMRHPEEFEAYAGGTLWINQGGAQGGQAGQFNYRRNDLEGGWASTLADLDGDGDPDVLVYTGISLRIGLNQGNAQGGQAGVFMPVASVAAPESEAEQYGVLLAGDLDGDSRVDALLLGRAHSAPKDGQPYPPNQSWTWLNKTDANGRFVDQSSPIPALDGLSAAAAALGDLDADGDLDLLAVTAPSQKNSMSGTTVLRLLNDGSGGFSNPGLYFTVQEGSSLALADLDADGDLDALAGYRSGAMLLTNLGGAQAGQTGSFAPAGRAIPGGPVRSVRLADLDGDGDLDAVTVSKRCEIWWNNGQASFTQAKQSFPCADNQDLALADLNGDGWVDIFLATYDQSAQVWLNDGKGGFREGDLPTTSLPNTTKMLPSQSWSPVVGHAKWRGGDCFVPHKVRVG